MQNGSSQDEKHLAVIGCGNKVANVAEGLVSMVEVMMRRLLLRLRRDENMMRADFKTRV